MIRKWKLDLTMVDVIFVGQNEGISVLTFDDANIKSLLNYLKMILNHMDMVEFYLPRPLETTIQEMLSNYFELVIGSYIDKCIGDDTQLISVLLKALDTISCDNLLKTVIDYNCDADTLILDDAEE